MMCESSKAGVVDSLLLDRWTLSTQFCTSDARLEVRIRGTLDVGTAEACIGDCLDCLPGIQCRLIPLADMWQQAKQQLATWAITKPRTDKPDPNDLHKMAKAMNCFGFFSGHWRRYLSGVLTRVRRARVQSGGGQASKPV